MRLGLSSWIVLSIAVLMLSSTALGADVKNPDADRMLARQLCETLHELPAKRKQECCHTATSSLVEACTQETLASLQRGAVRIDSDALQRCAQASGDSLKGCDWVGPLQPALPEACTGLIEGSAKVGKRCHSSLECSEGLYCQGLSPLAPGVCAAPARPCSRCERPADNLASFARAGDDPRHPSCDGVCLRGQCLAEIHEGGSCHASAVCAKDLNCIDGSCRAAPLPKLGATCATPSGCADGAICVDQRCVLPKAGGATCKLPFECRSLECRKKAGEASGVCVDACGVSRDVLSGA